LQAQTQRHSYGCTYHLSLWWRGL